MTDDEKTMHVSIAIGALETVRFGEEQINPKSARATALKNIIDNAYRVVDMYRINSWEQEKLNIAARVLEKIEADITRAFSPKTVTRCPKTGRFLKAL